MQAVGLLDGRLEVVQLREVVFFYDDVGTNHGSDLGLGAAEGGGVLDQLRHGPVHCCGCGVGASDEQVEH